MIKSYLPLALSLLAGCTITSAFAQVGGYNASYGDGRVVYGGNGLANPSGSYIGGGTVSASARGQIGYGAHVNGSLPSVSLGSHVGTAGDNQYTAAPIVNSQGSPAPAQQQRGGNGLPSSSWGANVRTAGDTIRSDLHPEYYRQQQMQQFQNQQRVQAQQQNPAFQQVIQRSGHGPLRYDDVSGAAHNF